MIKHLVPLVIALALTGCVTGNNITTTKGPYAWDGLGRDPNLGVRMAKKEFAPKLAGVLSAANETEELATLPSHSPQWWALHDRIERDMDAKLADALVICRGCQVDAEHTGAVTPR